MQPSPATVADLDPVSVALADAFADDPVQRWFHPQRDYPGRTRHLFRFLLDHAVTHGAVDVLWDGGMVAAAALWLPPGHWRVPPAAVLRGAGRILRSTGVRTPRALGRLTELERRHPAGPEHWYLEVLGVVRARQGQGLGSTLLAHRAAQFDAAGLPAYLESSNERNLPLYERHGFRVTEALTFRQGPPQWLMWREPGGPPGRAGR